jgi:hypothetical protein
MAENRRLIWGFFVEILGDWKGLILGFSILADSTAGELTRLDSHSIEDLIVEHLNLADSHLVECSNVGYLAVDV